MDHVLDIAQAPNRKSLHWEQGTITWSQLTSWANDPADRKEAGDYLLGVIDPTPVRHPNRVKDCVARHRHRTAIASRSALALDADSAPTGFMEAAELLLPGAAWIHTTYSSTPQAPRYRVVIPLSRPATPDEYVTLSWDIMSLLGLAAFDPSAARPNQYAFKPAAPDPAAFQSVVLDGPPLDVDATIAPYRDGAKVLPIPATVGGAERKDPMTLPGAVGAFNRAHTDLGDLIEQFELPYVGAGPERWRYEGTTSAPGMGEVADGLWYSHHAGDPASGYAQCAFDLVRIHKFADLDTKVAPAALTKDRPSHEAMLELAMADEPTMRLLTGALFGEDQAPEPVEQAPEGDLSWRVDLRYGPRNGKLLDVAHNWDILLEYDYVLQSLRYNEMSMSTEVIRDLPWRTITEGEVFAEADYANYLLYFERTYKLRPARATLSDMISIAAHRFRYHPVRAYLKSLKWDGQPRLETSLPGVEDTEHSRLVARKALVAAVARVLDPGCKADHTLVLYGNEGIGKTYWIERMAKGYTATLGRPGDKDTLVTMQRAWIMVSDEGHVVRAAEFEQLKEFLTRSSDVFRAPYAREALAYKRHNVIWATTNQRDFLRLQAGNRRFLVVECKRRVQFDRLTDDYIDQVWAEAVHMYTNGERLYLTPEEAAMAAQHREMFTEEDHRAGLILRYLETPVPEGWDDTPLDARKAWRAGREAGFEAPGTEQITAVCSLELWHEALGYLTRMTRSDSQDMARIMRSLPGWGREERAPLPQYGRQRVWQRTQ